ncbi:golgin subfamily A member 6-like protein 22 [Palaemon carinicauda]|uniref:golgin subfamily A member 6-like protein 22 n=1 Tax=Palaemon carinicauda TaxID=392227 RepID=UPI0035B64D69
MLWYFMLSIVLLPLLFISLIKTTREDLLKKVNRDKTRGRFTKKSNTAQNFERLLADKGQNTLSYGFSTNEEDLQETNLDVDHLLSENDGKSQFYSEAFTKCRIETESLHGDRKVIGKTEREEGRNDKGELYFKGNVGLPDAGTVEKLDLLASQISVLKCEIELLQKQQEEVKRENIEKRERIQALEAQLIKERKTRRVELMGMQEKKKEIRMRTERKGEEEEKEIRMRTERKGEEEEKEIRMRTERKGEEEEKEIRMRTERKGEEEEKEIRMRTERKGEEEEKEIRMRTERKGEEEEKEIRMRTERKGEEEEKEIRMRTERKGEEEKIEKEEIKIMKKRKSRRDKYREEESASWGERFWESLILYLMWKHQLLKTGVEKCERILSKLEKEINIEEKSERKENVRLQESKRELKENEQRTGGKGKKEEKERVKEEKRRRKELEKYEKILDNVAKMRKRTEEIKIRQIIDLLNFLNKNSYGLDIILFPFRYFLLPKFLREKRMIHKMEKIMRTTKAEKKIYKKLEKNLKILEMRLKEIERERRDKMKEREEERHRKKEEDINVRPEEGKFEMIGIRKEKESRKKIRIRDAKKREEKEREKEITLMKERKKKRRMKEIIKDIGRKKKNKKMKMRKVAICESLLRLLERKINENLKLEEDKRELKETEPKMGGKGKKEEKKRVKEEKRRRKELEKYQKMLDKVVKIEEKIEERKVQQMIDLIDSNKNASRWNVI